jgi:hypothetical protein
MGLKGLMDWARKEQFRHNQEEFNRLSTEAYQQCAKVNFSESCEDDCVMFTVCKSEFALKEDSK